MDLIHNKTLLKTYEDNIKTFGHYNRFPESEFPAGGSTDMGNVSYVVPSIHPMFYIGSDAFNHSQEFTKATGELAITKCIHVKFLNFEYSLIMALDGIPDITPGTISR